MVKRQMERIKTLEYRERGHENDKNQTGCSKIIGADEKKVPDLDDEKELEEYREEKYNHVGIG